MTLLSDPVIDRWPPARLATNQAMASRMRSGGWPYLLGCIAVVALAAELRSRPIAAFFYSGLFTLLAVARVVVCRRLMRADSLRQLRVERIIFAAYVVAAIAWVAFLARVFTSVRNDSAPI